MTFSQNLIAGGLSLSVFWVRATPFGSFLWAIWSNWKDVLDAMLVFYGGLMNGQNLTGLKQHTLPHNSVAQKSMFGVAGFSAAGHIQGWSQCFSRTMCLSGAPGPLPSSSGLEKNPVPRGCRRKVPIFSLAIIQGWLSGPRDCAHVLTQQCAYFQSQQQNFCFLKSLQLPLSAHLIIGTRKKISFFDKIEFFRRGNLIHL